jgi:hypothetical protein
MKKIIAATAGLLLVGSVSAASAAVTFTGDARERLILERDYNFVDQTNDFNTGRVRLVMNADTKGGATASVRMRFADGVYDGTNQTGKAGDGKGTDYYTDWAYLGIPIGPVTINAGLMPEADPQAMFFRYDKRFDRLAATYKAAKTSVTLEYSKDKEYTDPDTTTATTVYPAGGVTGPLEGSLVTHKGTDLTKDKDMNEYGVIVKQGFAADWSVMAIGLYKEDQVPKTSANPDNSGFMGFVNANGSAGPVKLGADFAWVDKKILARDKSGWGGALNARMEFGPAAATVIVGQTKDGYTADANYGFLMIGGAMGGANPDLPVVGSPIQVGGSAAPAGAIGYNGDTFFSGVIGDYKISNTVKLVGIVAYADVKDYAKLLEVSGLVRFDVTDGAYIDLGAGWLHPSSVKFTSADTENALGAFTELGIAF